VFVNCALLRDCLTLGEYLEMNTTRIESKLTVRSFTSVDFPAPFGPIIPTRLCNTVATSLGQDEKETYLDKESAQLTLKRLGVLLPGYVNVQPASFKIARVLLRTPMRDPGGGNANLTEVAASV
jgi:hypothetical protein